MYVIICDRLQENLAQCGTRKREKIGLILKNVLNKPTEGSG